MTIIEKKVVKIKVKSRFCAVCDSKVRWQCKCPNNKVMARQVKKSFHEGKRYRGKRALEYCYDTEKKNENI